MAASDSIPLMAKDDVHKPRPYEPSPWGNFFLDFKPYTPSQYASMETRANAKKEEVRKIIVDTANSCDLIQKMELVDTLERIGVDYHYQKEIDELVHDIDNDKSEVSDLRLTALRFYLLRKHGYRVSSDVFSKFIDDDGNIGSNDGVALLGLYNAAHLRTRGEKILDAAIISAKKLLKSIIYRLDPAVAQEVQYTLETPLFRRLHRVETSRYILAYQKTSMKNETILEFAKLDYNILQGLYCDELKNITLWWNTFDIRTQLPWARDRLVEMHFWMMGVLFEPHYSFQRSALTKLITLVSIWDDFYDNYSTSEESTVFTMAIDRWDKHAAEQAPTYMRSFYKGTVATVNQIEEGMKLYTNKHAGMVTKLMIDMANSYNAEVKWREEQYVPPNLEEHLQISLASAGCMHIANLAFALMGDITPTETVLWAWEYPTIIRAGCVIGRVMNDITSHEREQADKESKHMASTVQTCMKENGCTVDQAIEKLNQVVEEAWMDMSEGCLQPTVHPLAVLSRAVNLSRTMDFLYKSKDAYTLPASIKGTLDSIYVHSMDI